jgi:hypothetical protein
MSVENKKIPQYRQMEKYGGAAINLGSDSLAKTEGTDDNIVTILRGNREGLSNFLGETKEEVKKRLQELEDNLDQLFTDLQEANNKIHTEAYVQVIKDTIRSVSVEIESLRQELEYTQNRVEGRLSEIEDVLPSVEEAVKDSRRDLAKEYTSLHGQLEEIPSFNRSGADAQRLTADLVRVRKELVETGVINEEEGQAAPIEQVESFIASFKEEEKPAAEVKEPIKVVPETEVKTETYAEKFKKEVGGLITRAEAILKKFTEKGYTDKLQDDLDKIDKRYEELKAELEDRDEDEELTEVLKGLDSILEECFDTSKEVSVNETRDDNVETSAGTLEGSLEVIEEAFQAFNDDPDKYLENSDLRQRYREAAEFIAGDLTEEEKKLVPDDLSDKMTTFKEGVEKYKSERDLRNGAEEEGEENTPRLKRIKDGIKNMFAPGSWLRKGLKSIGNAFSEDRMRGVDNRQPEEEDALPELPELSRTLEENVLALRVEVDAESDKEKVKAALDKITADVKAKKDELTPAVISKIEKYIQATLDDYNSNENWAKNFKFNLEDSEAADTSEDSGDLPSDEELSKFGI